MKWIFTISIVIFSHGFFTQDIKVFEDSLISLLKNVQTEKNAQEAKHHNIEFKAYLEKTIKHPLAFSYPFDSLSKYMSTIKSPDESFRIFNWNIEQKNQTQFYECWILKNDKSLIKLKDYQKLIPEIEFATLNQNSWFGALYYKIIPIKKKTKAIIHYLDGMETTCFQTRKSLKLFNLKKTKYNLEIHCLNTQVEKLKKELCFNTISNLTCL